MSLQTPRHAPATPSHMTIQADDAREPTGWTKRLVWAFLVFAVLWIGYELATASPSFWRVLIGGKP